MTERESIEKQKYLTDNILYFLRGLRRANKDIQVDEIIERLEVFEIDLYSN